MLQHHAALCRQWERRDVAANDLDESELESSVRRSVEEAGFQLTPEQMRKLAEILYEMLRTDARSARARNQDGMLRR